MVAALDTSEVRDTVRTVLGRHAGAARARLLFDEPDHFDRDLWHQMAELGWLGTELPEAVGGFGAGFGVLTVVVEELASALAGGPFLSSAVLAAGAVLASGGVRGRPDLLAALAAGEVIGTVVCTDAAGRPGAAALVERGRELQLVGTSGFVTDAPLAGSLVVVARDGDGGDVLAVVPTTRDGLAVERIPVLDPTRTLGHVRFTGCPVHPDDVLARGPDATRAVAALRARACVAIAADSIGAARAVIDRTAAYARERVQFGVPIGAFQGVKHQCANMFVETEAASGVVAAAAGAIEAADEDADRLASMAKLYVCATAADVAGRGMQLHGGIGYTWEHDMHLYLKRAKLNEALFGDRSHHLRVVADGLVGAAPGA